MGRKCFISFKTEDAAYKKYILENLNIDMVDKSLHEAIDSEDDDYIMRKIREDYLSDSTVTIHLIGEHSAENKGLEEQKYIKRELQASLYNSKGNTRNGILGVVLPSICSKVFQGDYTCSTCETTHTHIGINDKTTIKEFSRNYFIQNGKCSNPAEDRYCVLVKWDDFAANAEKYIELAFQKRSAPVADKVTVYPR